MPTVIYLIPISFMLIMGINNINKWQDGGSHLYFVGALFCVISIVGFTWEILKRIIL